jgi:type I restriction enzyme S subunit
LTSDENGVNWIMIGDTKDSGKYIEKTAKKIKREGISNSRMVNEGDFLLTNSMSFGRPYILKTSGCIHDGWLVLSPKDENIHRDYFYYYLGSDEIKQRLSSKAAGAVVKNLNKEIVSDLVIELPPLPTQKRIAEILDAADALRRKDQELLKKYDELAQAIFIDMFGDPVKNEKGFNKVNLGDCLDNLQIGPFGTQLHESDYIKNGIPVINPMHIGDLKIKPNFNYSITEEKYQELPQYHLKPNDVILARRGEMGRCAIVNEYQGKCLCGTGSLYLTVNNNLLHPLFLVYVLSRKTTKIALDNASAGTTMANLNKSIINDFKIILPHIDMQKSFVRAVRISEDSIEHT